MEQWVLVVFLAASEVALPLASYNKQQECEAALRMWQFDPGASGECLRGIVEVSGSSKRKRRR